MYRDALYHGGVLSIFMLTWFSSHLMHHTIGRASQQVTDGWALNTPHFWLKNSLDNGALAASQAQWDKIKVPFYSVGNWTGFGLHLRGNTEAFMRSPNKHKKLRIHTGTHVHPFYREEAREEQMRFFDYWLKGVDNGVMDEPPVKLAVRHGADKTEWRFENEWPLKRTQWTKFYFDFSPVASGAGDNSGALVSENPKETSSRTYTTMSIGTMGYAIAAASAQVIGGSDVNSGMGISLETPPLPNDVEVTGPLAASFWVSSTSEDMDLFLTLRHFDADGNEVLETGQQGRPVPVAKGWLRVSHRELDPDLTLPYRPYHKHRRRLFLKPDEIVKVDVEIWPTSMVFKKGHRIRLDVQPRDGIGSRTYMHYYADYNTGTNTVYAGGKYESYLLLPLIPVK
jgi:putative CocE/NonD family hydrolase